MTNFEFQEKGHKYFLDGKPMTGVTTVLGVIAKPALIQWAADMANQYICDNISYAIPGEDGGYWAVKPSVVEEARKAHTKKKEAAGTKGTDVHALVENYIKECIEKHDGVATGTITTSTDKMLANFMQWSVDNNIIFLESEKKVYSKEWFCAGTFDFSFEKDGKRYIGDLKTMGKIWDRVPFFQTAAYRKMSVEMGEAPYDGSCIVNISKPSEKYPSELTDAWSYDWESDQKAFESALYLYRQLNN